MVIPTVSKETQQKDEPGHKTDAGKCRLDLIPPEPLFGVGWVLEFGARKYGDRNWEQGMSWGRLFGAAMRHLWAFWMLEEEDFESKLPHLNHALCCLMMLATLVQREMRSFDDRKAHPVQFFAPGMVVPCGKP